MHIYLWNTAVKLQSDPIWNDGALGFLKRSPQQQEEQEEQQDE